MGPLLFIVSFLLVGIFTPIGMLFTIIKSVFLLKLKPLGKYYFNLAISLDQFGNVVMSGFFNIVLINGNEHLFGDPDETISSVLGKNKRAGTLAYLGRRLDALLNGLDKNHSIKSIEE